MIDKKKVKPRPHLGDPLPPVLNVTFSQEEIARADARAKLQSPFLWALLNARMVKNDDAPER